MDRRVTNFPLVPKVTIRGAIGWRNFAWAFMSEKKTVSHPLVAMFDLSRLRLPDAGEFVSPNGLNRQ